MHAPQTGEQHSGAWGALAGVVGGLCCVGPSAAVLLGLGSSSALAGLALDRNLALAAGALLLVAGVMFALRQARACALRGVARWRTPALMVATFVLSYAVIGVLLPAIAANRVAVEAMQVQPVAQAENVGSTNGAPALRRATLVVTKMECPPCAAHVRSLLKRKPFVRAFFAEEGIDTVTIDYDSGQITPEALAKLIPLRYGVELMSDVTLPS
jgi:hypothetical protein